MIYLHIPKTGGNSVRKTLRSCVGKQFSEYFQTRVPYMHSDAMDSKNYVGEKIWNSYVKFAAVRNPFSRLISWYKHPITKARKRIRFSEMEIKRLSEKSKLTDDEKRYLQLLPIKLQKAEETRLFLEDKNNFPEMFSYWKTEEYRNRMAQRIDKFYIFQNQFDWLNLENNKGILVYKLEEMSKKWKEICTIFNLDFHEFDYQNKSSARIEIDYKEYYTNEIINEVSKIYEKDLREFKYEF